MKKLIYADDLQAQLSRKKPEACNQRFTDGFNDALMRFKSMIHSAPAVDAVPVVRCKSCRWSKKVDTREPMYACTNIVRYGCSQWLGSDDFCSYGEPKEDNHG